MDPQRAGQRLALEPIGVFVHKEVVMTGKTTLHFLVTDGPGPFQLVAEMVDMFRDRLKPLILEFELKPVEAGEKFLGHNRKFKIQFEVALLGLLGPTTSMGHGAEEPRNIKLFGRFHVTFRLCEQEPDIDSVSAAAELGRWQWVSFFPTSGRREGLVERLDQPLPKLWTL